MVGLDREEELERHVDKVHARVGKLLPVTVSRIKPRETSEDTL